jgi:hypothetical protein
MLAEWRGAALLVDGFLPIAWKSALGRQRQAERQPPMSAPGYVAAASPAAANFSYGYISALRPSRLVDGF